MDMSWLVFLDCLGFGFVFISMWSLPSSYIICTQICIDLTVPCRSHHIARHDWSIVYNCLHTYWSNYFSVIIFSKYENDKKTKPKPKHFRQFRNPSQVLHLETQTEGKLLVVVLIVLPERKRLICYR